MRLRMFVPLVAVLLFGIVYTAPRERAYAQAEEAAPAIGTALAAVIEATLEAAGYSATDAVVAATLAAVSSEAGVAAAGVAAAAGLTVAAVPWVAVAAAVGVAALLGSDSVPLGSGGSQQWQFNSDGTVTVSQSPSSGSSSGSSFPPITSGSTVYCMDGSPTSPNADTGCGGSVAAAGAAYAEAETQQKAPTWTFTVTSCSSTSCTFELYENGADFGPTSESATEYTDYSGAACSTGLLVGTSGCETATGASVPPPVTESASAAAANTPSGDDGDELSPAVLAALANALWQQAADQSGYTGVPYPASAPVTSSQASSVESSLGSSAPTIGSAVTGAGSLSGASSSTPFAVTAPSGTSTGTSTGASGTSGGGTDGTPDLCQLDPTASACADLGTPPASGAIPSSSVSVSMSPWSIGPASGTCPSPIVVQVFGTSLTFDYTPVCTFAGRVEPVVLAVCALAAALIVVGGLKS